MTANFVTTAGTAGNNAVQHDDTVRHAWEANMAGIISQEMSVQNQEMMFSDAYSFFAGVAGSHENFGNLGVVPGGVGVGAGPGPDQVGGASGGNNVPSRENTGGGAAPAASGMEFFDWTGFGVEGNVEGRRYF